MKRFTRKQEPSSSPGTYAGRYIAPGKSPESGADKPLYLHISAGTHLKSREHGERARAVDAAVAMVEAIMGKRTHHAEKNPSAYEGLKVPDFTNVAAKPAITAAYAQNSYPPGGLYAATVYLGFLPHSSFNIQEQICGPNNQYLNHIQRVTGATVTLRGQGSGNLEGARGEELPDPLHLLMKCSTMEGLNDAKTLAENLVETVKQDYGLPKDQSLYHQSAGLEPHGSGQYSAGLTSPVAGLTGPQPPTSYLSTTPARGPHIPQPPQNPLPPSFVQTTPAPYSNHTITSGTQPELHHPLPSPSTYSTSTVQESPYYQPHPPSSQPYYAASQDPRSSSIPYASAPPPTQSNPRIEKQEKEQSQQYMGLSGERDTREGTSSWEQIGTQPFNAYPKVPEAPLLSHTVQPTSQQPQPPPQASQDPTTQYPTSSYAATPTWKSPSQPQPYSAIPPPAHPPISQSPQPPQSPYPGYSSVGPEHGSSPQQGFGSSSAMALGSYQGVYNRPAMVYPYQGYGVYQGAAGASSKPSAGSAQGPSSSSSGQIRLPAPEKPVQQPQRRRFQEFPDGAPVSINQTVKVSAPQASKSSSQADSAAKAMPPPPPKSMPFKAPPQVTSGGMQPSPENRERPAVVFSTTSKLVEYGEEDEDEGGVSGSSQGGPSMPAKPFWAT